MNDACLPTGRNSLLDITFGLFAESNFNETPLSFIGERRFYNQISYEKHILLSYFISL